MNMTTFRDVDELLKANSTSPAPPDTKDHYNRWLNLDQDITYILTMAITVLILFGVISNAMVVLSFILSSRCKRPHYIFIFCIGISGLLVCSIHDPLVLLAMISHLKLESSVCKIFGGLFPVCACTSLYMMASSALNR